jgi:hypothetical protein
VLQQHAQAGAHHRPERDLARAEAQARPAPLCLITLVSASCATRNNAIVIAGDCFGGFQSSRSDRLAMFAADQFYSSKFTGVFDF